MRARLPIHNWKVYAGLAAVTVIGFVIAVSWRETGPRKAIARLTGQPELTIAFSASPESLSPLCGCIPYEHLIDRGSDWGRAKAVQGLNKMRGISFAARSISVRREQVDRRETAYFFHAPTPDQSAPILAAIRVLQVRLPPGAQFDAQEYVANEAKFDAVTSKEYIRHEPFINWRKDENSRLSRGYLVRLETASALNVELASEYPIAALVPQPAATVSINREGASTLKLVERRRANYTNVEEFLPTSWTSKAQPDSYIDFIGKRIIVWTAGKASVVNVDYWSQQNVALSSDADLVTIVDISAPFFVRMDISPAYVHRQTWRDADTTHVRVDFAHPDALEDTKLRAGSTVYDYSSNRRTPTSYRLPKMPAAYGYDVFGSLAMVEVSNARGEVSIGGRASMLDGKGRLSLQNARPLTAVDLQEPIGVPISATDAGLDLSLYTEVVRP
jgi:hypothetical protein